MAEDNPFGGKPRSAPIRKTPVARIRAKTWGDDIDYAPLEVDEAGQDRLHIPKALVQAIKRDDGVVLQWVTKSVYGQDMGPHTAKFMKNYWAPVHQSDLGGVLDGRFMPKGRDGEIEVDGLVLMARPTEVDDRARVRDRRDANEPLQVKRQQMLDGGMPGVADADHPTALRTNRINRTFESVAIPGDA